jgi:hypothetical protein
MTASFAGDTAQEYATAGIGRSVATISNIGTIRNRIAPH